MRMQNVPQFQQTTTFITEVLNIRPFMESSVVAVTHNKNVIEKFEKKLAHMDINTLFTYYSILTHSLPRQKGSSTMYR